VLKANLYSFRRYEKRLLKAVNYVLDKSEFYKQKYASLSSFEFTNLPFTEKSELLADQERIPPFGSNLCVELAKLTRIHRTSGSSGRPLFLALSKKDVDITTEVGSDCFRSAGLTPNDVVFHCLNYCLWIGGYTDHQSLERTGATVIPFGIGNSIHLIENILHLKPTAIHCTPSYLSRLEFLLQTEFAKNPRDLGLIKGLFGGEGGLDNSSFRQSLEEKWGMSVINANYGVSDVLSMIGSECSARAGLHFIAEKYLYPELVDPENLAELPLAQGAVGELVLTNLKKQAQPLVRFRTRDLIEIVSTDACACGRTSFRFRVVGRTDDLFVVKGVNFFPGSIGSILAAFLEEINGEFQVRVGPNRPIETFAIYFETRNHLSSESRKKIKSAILHQIQTKFFVSPEIVLVPEGSLEKSDDGKTKKVVRV
jgi:phenylacetate-CoA ligase